MHPVDLVQLRTFIATAEEQNLTKAAERLHLSLSAASAHIKAVEQNLGIQLFNRVNRSLELSPHGKALLSKAKVLLNDASSFSSYARSLSDQVCGQIAISSIADPADSRIGPITSTILKRHPLVKMNVYIRHAMGTAEGLKTGELDLGMALCQATDPALSYIHLTTFRYRIVGPAAWRDRVEDADLKSLAGEPWVAFTDKHLAYPHILENMFSGLDLEKNVVARTDNHMLARALAESEIGLTLLPERRALDGVQAGLLCISNNAISEYDLFVAYLKNRENDPLIDATIDAIYEVWPDAKPVPPLDTE